MPSPFPGMNPYLEQPQVWHDFHQRYATAISSALVPQVRPGYFVTLDDNIYIHESLEDKRTPLGRGDVNVGSTGRMVSDNASTTALVPPALGRVEPLIENLRESYIEIRDRNSRELITVIEILSPSNKRPGKDRDQFERKRELLMLSTANYVEIDLLRGGPRMPIQYLPECDAYVMVSRYEDRPEVGLWPVALEDVLPTIPIPLKPDSKPATLDLQALLHQTYDAAGYEDYIYSTVPDPPLSEQRFKWAAELLTGAQSSSGDT